MQRDAGRGVNYTGIGSISNPASCCVSVASYCEPALRQAFLREATTGSYFLNGRGGGQSEHERGREGGKDGPFNQHTHALACLHYGYGCEPRLRERQL